MHFQLSRSQFKQIFPSFAIMLAWTSTSAYSQTGSTATSPSPSDATTAPAAAIANQSPASAVRAVLNSEFMTPSFSASNSVPNSDGSAYQAMNAANVFFVDYEFAPKLRFLYWQRSSAEIKPSSADNSFSWAFKDPRFALRYVNKFMNSTLSFTLDTYYNVPLTSASAKIHKLGDLGFRTSTTYTPTGSRFTVGAITDLYTSFYSEAGTEGNDLLYTAAPYLQYTINKKFNTEHIINVTLYHKRNASWSDITSNDQAPYIQNGITWNATDSIAVSALLNNYLGALPTLQNSWVSLGLNVVFL